VDTISPERYFVVDSAHDNANSVADGNMKSVGFATA